ncbi:MAG: glycerol-3-phosphate dehydrogenase/oxidase [Planctomycetota bacterium]
MRTDPRQLHERKFDLVVVGAGIQGAAIARDAAVRGLDVLLVDARDVAAGTSSRSSRLVHGGLRYLRHGHFALVREALHERERLLRLAPHLVRPLPMLVPFFGDSSVGRWQLRLGTWLYSRLAGRSTLPRPETKTAAQALAAFPGLRERGLRSGLLFFDARTQDGRLTLANVRDAVRAGAVFCNRVRAVGCDDRGVRLCAGGDELTVRCAEVVNATGPAVDPLRRALGVDGDELVRTSRGSHVVLPPRAGELSLCAFLPDQRIQFVVPHDGGTLCGTTDVDDHLVCDEGPPPAVDLDYLWEALGYLLEPPPQPDDVRFAYCGWRALPNTEGPPGALNREGFVVGERIACGRLHTVVGGKLTTHRSFAERAVAAMFGLDPVSPTRDRTLPGGDGPREVDDPLWWRHGSLVRELRAQIRMQPDLAEPLCPHRPLLAAELVHAVANEGAATFADAVLRRLIDVRGPCVEPACLQRALEVFARAGGVVDDAAAEVAAVHAELLQLTGDLESWRRRQP